MKKKIVGMLVLIGLVSSVATPVHAETHRGDDNWNVSFTAEDKMVSSFKTKDVDDVILGMQPGDDAIITLKLKNENSSSTNWYMTNEVLDSLEDGSQTAEGGAYTYTLTYTGPTGTQTVLYDSDTLGGDSNSRAVNKDNVGLNAATSALEDYFLLGTLKNNESGVITLRVALEGETQGNSYQNTLANLQMNFAVEKVNINQVGSDDSTSNRTSVVRTGDESNMMPFVVVAAVSGIILLVFAIYSVKQGKKEKERGAAR